MLFSSLVGAANIGIPTRGRKNLPGGPSLRSSSPRGYWEKRGKEPGQRQLMPEFAQLWAPLVASVQQ